MATKRLPWPRDPLQLGKLIVDIATSEGEDRVEDGKDPAAAAMGRKGGAARAAKLTLEERADVLGRAARSRWRRDQS